MGTATKSKGARRPALALDDALALLAHDIRSSTTVIRGFAVTLRERDGALTPTERRIGLDAIERHALLVQRLAEDLIEVGRAEAGRLELELRPVELAAVVAATVERARVDHPEMRFMTGGPIGGVRVVADALRIEQVLTNLINNAVKSAPRGSVIEVITRRVDDDGVVTVKDHGPGFPDTAALFRKYSHDGVHRDGSGLGLYLCRLLVEAHHGQIWAVNDHPGATVGFRLPAAP